jgi:hypothetical protein
MVEGCKGGSFTGALRFRKPTRVRITTMAIKRAIASVAILLPVLGFPAITAETKMQDLPQGD